MDPTKWELEDGEAMASRYPSTFRIPLRMWRESLPPMTYVKLSFYGVGYQASEQMWIQIRDRVETPGAIEGTKLIRFRGLVKSKPATLQGLAFNDTIEFGVEHIIDVD